MRTRSRFSPLFRFVVVGAFACANGGCAIKLPDWVGDAGGSGGSGGSTEEPGSGGSGGSGGVATTGTVAMTTSSSSMTTTTTVTTGVGGAPATTTVTTGAGGDPATTVTTGAGGAPATTTVTTGVGGSPAGVTTGVGGAPTTTTGVGGVDPTTATTGVGGAPATTTVTTGVGGAPAVTVGVGVGGGVAVSVGVGVGGGTGVGGAPQTTSSTGASITVGVGSTTSTSTTTTGVGGGASSSSTGTSTPADEACPGEAHTVDLGVTLTLSGSTVGGADDLHPPSGACFGAPDSSGPDVVYAVTFSSAGTLNASLHASNGLKGVLYAEKTCGDAASLAFCGAANGDGARSQAMAVTAGETMYFVVDGDAGTAGDFSLSFDLEAAACGDGVQNADEQCDDGNTADGDGCSATCTFEAPVDASDACPGDVVAIDMAETLDIEGTMPAPLGASTTLNYSDNYLTCDGVVSGSPIANAPDQGGNDRVFRFVPSADGTLFLQLRNVGVDGGGFDAMLSAWANTCTPAPADDQTFDYDTGTDAAKGDYMGCSDHAGGGDTWDPGAPDDAWTQEALTFDVVAGTPYFVVVDGYAGYSAGNFWLHAELTPKL